MMSDNGEQDAQLGTDSAESSAVVQSEDPAPVDVSARSSAEKIAEIIDQWWAERIHGSALARSTEAWNHVVGAIADLKERLAQALK